MKESIKFYLNLLDKNKLEYNYNDLLDCLKDHKRKNDMSKIVLFSRVSSIGQDLVQQTNELHLEAEKLGYDKEHQIVIEYKESAICLSIDERKGIQELKEQIEKTPEIDCVLIYEISRLSRQTTMLYEIRDWLIQHSIQLVCLKPYFRLLENDKMSQTASILFSLFSSLSESEMMIKKERMVRGKLFKRDQGKYIGGRILFGYKIGKDDKIEINYTDAETVRQIFTWYRDGKSMLWIGKEILSRGLSGDKWCDLNSAVCCIKRLLRRKEYMGVKCDTYEYQQIISEELFNSVQPKLTKNKTKCIAKKEFLGRGILKEKSSGFSLTGCGRNYRVFKIGKPTELTINSPIIDKFIWEICSRRAKTITKDKMKANYLHDRKVLMSKIDTLNEHIDRLKYNIDKINERIIYGKMSEAKGDMLIKDIEKEIAIRNETFKSLTRTLLELKPNEVNLNNRKEVVDNEIETIYVSKLPSEDKFLIKELQVNFKDGTSKTYIYKSKATKIFIYDGEELILKNGKE